jgi:hypothetical protein
MLFWSWILLLRSDTHWKPITSITAVLLPFVAHLLTLINFMSKYRYAYIAMNISRYNSVSVFWKGVLWRQRSISLANYGGILRHGSLVSFKSGNICNWTITSSHTNLLWIRRILDQSLALFLRVCSEKLQKWVCYLYQWLYDIPVSV